MSSVKVPAARFTCAVFCLIPFSLMFTSCQPEKIILTRHASGPNLSAGGPGGPTGRVFRIERFRKKGKNRDLFNHIYFKGDTLGFSLAYNKGIQHARARFINPLNHTSVPAERVEITGSRVFGFILLGSLMENFYRESLDRPAVPDGFCCRNIGYTVEVTVTAGKDPEVSEITDHFIIEYIN